MERLVLPASAIVRAAGFAHVLVIENDRVRRRDVGAGESSEDGVIALSGVSEDSLVLTEPVGVSEGAAVRPKLRARERGPEG